MYSTTRWSRCTPCVEDLWSFEVRDVRPSPPLYHHQISNLRAVVFFSTSWPPLIIHQRSKISATNLFSLSVTTRCHHFSPRSHTVHPLRPIFFGKHRFTTTTFSKPSTYISKLRRHSAIPPSYSLLMDNI